MIALFEDETNKVINFRLIQKDKKKEFYDEFSSIIKN
jgi:hypothetical protein